MKKKFCLLLISTAIIVTPPLLYAQSIRTITLKDGSTLKGQILQVQSGVYSIQTQYLGTVQIPESEILNIASQEYAPPAPSSNIPASFSGESLKPQVDAMQQKILSDPEIISDIQNIAQDKKIMEMLQDPALLKDIQSYDANRIKGNQKIQELMQNQKMQNLLNKASQKINTAPSNQ